MENIIAFFAGYTSEQLIVLLVGSGISIVQGLYPGISILEWLKSKLEISDTRMEIVSIAFFMILSALAMFVTGELGEVQWNLEYFLANFAIFKGLAKLAYEMLKERSA